MRYFIDPSFTRTGIFITNGETHRLEEIKCLEKRWTTKKVKGKEVKSQVNEKLVDYHDAFRVSLKVVTALSALFYRYPPEEVNIEVPGIRGFKIERFLWGLSFQIVNYCRFYYLQVPVRIKIIQPNIVGNCQKKFLQEKEFPDVKLNKVELKKLARRGRSVLVQKYMPEILAKCQNSENLNDDKSTALLFYFFQLKYNLVYQELEI